MNRLNIKKRTWNESFEALKRYKERHGNTLVPVHTCKEDPALGGWVNHQRSKKDKLSEEQRQLLDSIGFAWSCRNRNKTWNPMIDALKNFQKNHGHCDVPEVYQADQKLADFVKEQKSKYQRGQLSTKRLKQLEEIGLVLKDPEESEEEEEEEEEEDDDMEENGDDGGEEEGNEETRESNQDENMILYDSAFKVQYQKLVDYHIKYGHCRVPKFSRRGDTLGLWVASLKRKYDENPETAMEPRCFELLEELDFFSTPAPAPAPKKRFSSGLSRRLPISKASVKPTAVCDDNEEEEEGEDDDDEEEEEEDDTGVAKPVKLEDVKNVDVEVAVDDASGASTDNEENNNEDDDTTSDEEGDDKSDAASATTASSGGSDGDTDNENDDKKDGESRSAGSGKSKRRLSEISQTSSQAKSRANYRDERFMKQFQDLVEFKKQYGHCRVPQSKRFKTLGGWVNNLRVVYNRDPENGVRPDRKAMLDSVGFIWNAGADRPGNDARWEEQYKHLLEFKKKFGHCRVPQTGPHRKLGRWVATQRALYVKDPVNGIRADRLQRLNDIEFTWDAKGYKGRHFYSLAAGPGQKPAPTQEHKPAAVSTSEACKAESDATESDDDGDVVAAQVDEDAPPVKAEDGGEAWVGPVDAVAIPSSADDNAAAATSQSNHKVQDTAGKVKVKVEDQDPAAAASSIPVETKVKLEDQAPATAASIPVESKAKVEDQAPAAAAASIPNKAKVKLENGAHVAASVPIEANVKAENTSQVAASIPFDAKAEGKDDAPAATYSLVEAKVKVEDGAQVAAGQYGGKSIGI